jgi:hypothetical protein
LTKIEVTNSANNTQRARFGEYAELGNDIFHHMAGHVGQSKVAASVSMCESQVIEPQQMQNRSVQVVYVDFVLGRIVPEFVSRTVLDT